MLVLGAPGGMALQSARHFGVRTMTAVGRDERKLERLEADVRLPLDDNANARLREQFASGVDVVLNDRDRTDSGCRSS